MTQRTPWIRSLLRLVLTFGAAVPACADLADVNGDEDGAGAALSTGTGLQADYFNNQTLTAPAAIRRTDATVNFNWGSGSPGSGVGVDHFSARWTGQVEALFTQTYTFFTTSDDGVRLWVNGQRLVNNWTNHSVTENSGSISLTAGQSVPIKVEFFDAEQEAIVKMKWSYPGHTNEVVPSSQLYAQ